jgi:glycosyltransferase involved in cell wall biosynthesis
MLGIPVINNVCGLGTVFLNKGLVSIVALTLYKIAFRFPRKIFFQNPDDRELFLLKKLVEASSTDLLPGSGIDLTYFSPYNKPKIEKQFTFLMISRIIHDKGVVEFIEAARLIKHQFPGIEFQLLGAIDEKHKRGISRELVQSWIDSGLIKYLEPAEDVRPAIAASDCVVLPSYREGTPRTLLEAAGMAKPLIATNVPGCRQLINHGENGFLCRLKDATDLAHQMEKMFLLTSEQRDDMGANSRKMVEKDYDEQLVINKYLRSIAEINPALV